VKENGIGSNAAYTAGGNASTMGWLSIYEGGWWVL